MGKRPGYLKQYATHAGISRQAAADQLERVGIDYLSPFDFSEADKRREAARHADRIPFSKVVYDEENQDWGVDPETKKDPKFIESQARREMFKAKLTELEYLERVGKLIPAEDVDREWGELAKLVRDSMLNIPPRLADRLKNQTDDRKIIDILEQEIYQALEAIASKEDQAA